MGYKIGINGLGRIGRDVLRCALKRPDIEVMAVNHKSRRIQVTDTYAQSIAHMVKYDSIYGVFDQEVDSTQDAVVVNGHQIKIVAEREPTRLPWKELGVDYVVESTGVLNDPAVAAGHIQAGAKKVILTGPAKGGECLTVVMGVNEEEYDPGRHHVVSNASCTTNCLAPVAKVLNEQFGIVKGLMTTVRLCQ